jgi:phenylacetaldehyde dehydrogenase
MEGFDLADVDVRKNTLEHGEHEKEQGQESGLPWQSPNEGEHQHQERADREDEPEHSMGLDGGPVEQVQTDEKELNDDAEKEKHRETVEEHSRLGHAGILPSMAVVAEREFGLFIGGELAEPASGEVRELVEPATGAPLAKAAMAGEEDVDRAVEAARKALEGPWTKTPPNERSRLLHALADAIVANRKELTELETRNVGKAISSVKGEVAVAAENFRWYASAIASIAGRTTPIGGSILAYTLKEPVGVAAQIVPWNYPIMMAAWKLAPALAAGCTVVLKPDPATPLTALRVAELAAEVGIPAGVRTVGPGAGPPPGAYLVRQP